MLLNSGCAIMEELRTYCYEGSNMKAFDAYLFLVECGIRNKKYDSLEAFTCKLWEFMRTLLPTIKWGTLLRIKVAGDVFAS